MEIEREIDNPDGGVVEGIIAKHFDMGYPSSSNFPIQFPLDNYKTYTLIGTKSNGKFRISMNKKTNGKYQLNVSLVDLKKKQ